MPKALFRALLDSPAGAVLARLGQRLLHPWPVRKLHFENGRYANRAVARRRAGGCNLVGFASAEFGIGQHLRSTADACQRAGIPITVFDYRRTLHPRGDDALAHLVDHGAPFGGTIFCLNNDGILDLWHSHRTLFRDRYTIAFGFWELNEFPESWLPAMNILDEVWAPSRYVRDAIAHKASVPVLHMPPAVDFDVSGHATRADVGIPRDGFVFLFVYDHSSTIARKNPTAVVRAFRSAFPDGSENVFLVLKSKTNEDVDYQVEGREVVREAVAGDSRILLIDEPFSRGQILDLIAASDCYVSLHRAEGFGLGMAEAMKMGKPVIATGYSGNMDFMSPDTACLVDFELVEAAPDETFGLISGAMWAAPDEDHAAQFMKRLADNPAYARELGSRAKAHMDEHHGHAAIGGLYRRRLHLIGLLDRGK